MSDQRFYAKSLNDYGTTGYVPAKFLMRNGAYVMNPTPGGSQQSSLYSDSSGNDETKGSLANPNNYLVVPENYTEQKARDFAAQIANTRDGIYPGDVTGAAGAIKALLDMGRAFRQGGSQDLQRGPQWGIPNGSVVPAFVGGASNHLGFVTGLAGVPKQWSEIGGGAVNTINGDVVQPMRSLFGKPTTPINTSGSYGLSAQNDSNISQGYSDGMAARSSPSTFDDDHHSPQPVSSAGQIGDGNGIAGWTSSLAGVDPQEPTPPTWPPQVDRPIRYLGRRTQ